MIWLQKLRLNAATKAQVFFEIFRNQIHYVEVKILFRGLSTLLSSKTEGKIIGEILLKNHNCENH
jgi:hypothetical protein